MTALPNGWKLRPLTDLAEVRLGRQRAPRNHSGVQMRPYLRAANVGWGGLRLDDVNAMNFTDAEMLTYRLEPGDILLSEASGSPREVGKPALWDGEIKDCAFQNTLIRVRAHDAAPRFLLYFFKYLALSGQFVQQSRGVGIYHLSRTRLASWPTPDPPLREQWRIVDILEGHLSCLDAAERQLETTIIRAAKLLETSLWRATHGQGSSVTLNEIAEVRLGRQRSPKNHSGDGMAPYLRAANVDWNRLRLEDVKTMSFSPSETAALRLRDGDILLTEASGSPSEVGKSVIYQSVAGTGDVCFQNTLLRVRCNTAALARFVQKYLLAEAITGRFIEHARGVGIHHLGLSRLAAWRIELPDETRQLKAAAEAEHAIDVSDRLTSQVRAAHTRSKALRRALLSAAFSGRLTGTSTDIEVIKEVADAQTGARAAE